MLDNWRKASGTRRLDPLMRGEGIAAMPCVDSVTTFQ
jgi:hypothetical protein